MQTLKQILLSLLEKKGFNTVNNPDSIWSRSSAGRAGAKHKDGPNAQQASGADVAEKMGFESEPFRSVSDAQPMSLMDLVFQTWGVRPKNKLKKKPGEDDE